MWHLYLKGLRNTRRMTPRPLKKPEIKFCYSAYDPKNVNPHLHSPLKCSILGSEIMSSGRMFQKNTLPTSLQMNRRMLAKFGM